jgi:hypothetical protein
MTVDSALIVTSRSPSSECARTSHALLLVKLSTLVNRSHVRSLVETTPSRQSGIIGGKLVAHIRLVARTSPYHLSDALSQS